MEGHNVIKCNKNSLCSCQNCSDTSVYFLDMISTECVAEVIAESLFT